MEYFHEKNVTWNFLLTRNGQTLPPNSLEYYMTFMIIMKILWHRLQNGSLPFNETFNEKNKKDLISHVKKNYIWLSRIFEISSKNFLIPEIIFFKKNVYWIDCSIVFQISRQSEQPLGWPYGLERHCPFLSSLCQIKPYSNLTILWLIQY